MNATNEALATEGARTAEHVAVRPAIAPPVDVYENADGLLVIADLPGVAEQDLDVRIDKDHLLIEGRVGAPPEGTLLAADVRALDFRREFLVPRGIDAQKITATLTHGVLRVTLPRSASLKPRKIEVRAA